MENQFFYVMDNNGEKRAVTTGRNGFFICVLFKLVSL